MMTTVWMDGPAAKGNRSEGSLEAWGSSQACPEGDAHPLKATPSAGGAQGAPPCGGLIQEVLSSPGTHPGTELGGCIYKRTQ